MGGQKTIVLKNKDEKKKRLKEKKKQSLRVRFLVVKLAPFYGVLYVYGAPVDLLGRKIVCKITTRGDLPRS